MINSNPKILPLQDLAHHLDKIRKNKKIVLCHGVFDLLHIGHIKYFENAKTHEISFCSINSNNN